MRGRHSTPRLDTLECLTSFIPQLWVHLITFQSPFDLGMSFWAKFFGPRFDAPSTSGLEQAHYGLEQPELVGFIFYMPVLHLVEDAVDELSVILVSDFPHCLRHVELWRGRCWP